MPEYKGLTIKLEGDATSLSTALAEVSRAAKVAEGNLTGINKALKFDSTNKLSLMKLQTENYGKAAKQSYKRAFELASGFEENTKKLKSTKSALDDAKDSLAKLTSTGRDWVGDKKRYDELGNSLSDVQGKMAKSQSEIEKLEKKRSKLVEGGDAYKRKTKEIAAEQSKLSSYEKKAADIESERQKLYDSGIGQYNELTQKVASLSDEYEGLYKNQSKIPVDYHTAIAQAEDYATKMRKSSNEYDFQSTKAAKLSAALKTSGEAISNIGGSISKVSGRFSSAGESLTMLVTLPLVGLGKTVEDTTVKFGNYMSQMSAYLNVPAAKMSKLRNEALKYGQDTIFSASESAQAMIELAKGGLTEAQISGGALASTLDLAAAGNMGLADAAEIVVTEMGAFNLTAKDSANVANALAGGANASTADVNTLAQGLNNVGAVAQNVGWSLQDTTVALAALNDNGRKGATAGTDLKTMLMRLMAPTDKAADVMKKYGINVRDANGHMKNLYDLSDEFKTKLSGLNDAQRDAALSTIFGTRAINGMSILMDEGSKGLQKYKSAVNDNTAASRMAKAQLGEVGWAMENLRGTAETAAIKFGDSMQDTVVNFIGGAQDLLEWFGNLDKGTQKQIGTFALYAAAAGPVLLVLGKLGQGIGKVTSAVGTGIEFTAKFIDALGKAGSGASVARQALSEFGDNQSDVLNGASKLGGLKDEYGTAMAGAASETEKGASRISKAIEDIDVSTGSAPEKLKSEVSDTVSDVASTVESGVSNVESVAKSGGSRVADGFVNGFNAVGQKTAQVITSPIKTISDDLSNAASTIKDKASSAATAAANGFRGLGDGIQAAIDDVPVKVGNVIDTTTSTVKSAAEDIPFYAEYAASTVSDKVKQTGSDIEFYAEYAADGVKTKVSSMKDGIVNGFRGIGDGIQRAIDAVPQKVGGALDNARSTLESVASGSVKATDAIASGASNMSSKLSAAGSSVANTANKVSGSTSVFSKLKSAISGVKDSLTGGFTGGGFLDVSNEFTKISDSAPKAASGAEKASDAIADVVESAKPSNVTKFNDSVEDIPTATSKAAASAGILETAFMNMGMSAEAASAQVMALKVQAIGLAAIAVISIATKAWADYTAKQKKAKEESDNLKASTDGLKDAVDSSSTMLTEASVNYDRLSSSSSNAALSQDDLTKKLMESASTIRDRNKSAADEVSMLTTTQAALDRYLNTTGLTVTEQGRLKDAVAEFNSETGMSLVVVDAANGKVQDSTGELTGEKGAYVNDTKAIDDYIKKKKEQAKVDALTSNLKDLYEDQNEETRTYADNQNKITKATKDVTKAQKEYNKAKKEVDQATDRGSRILAVKKLKAASDALDSAKGKLKGAKGDLKDSKKQLDATGKSIDNVNKQLGELGKTQDNNNKSSKEALENLVNSDSTLSNYFATLDGGDAKIRSLGSGLDAAGISADEFAKKMQESPEAMLDLADAWSKQPDMATLVEWASKYGLHVSDDAKEVANLEEQIKNLNGVDYSGLEKGFSNAGTSMDDFVRKLQGANVSFDTLYKVGGDRLSALGKETGYNVDKMTVALSGLQNYNLSDKNFTVGDNGSIQFENGNVIDFNAMTINDKPYKVIDPNGTIHSADKSIDGLNVKQIADKKFGIDTDKSKADSKMDDVDRRKMKKHKAVVDADTRKALNAFDGIRNFSFPKKVVEVRANISSAVASLFGLGGGGGKKGKKARGGIRTHADGGVAIAAARYHADGGSIVDAPHYGYPLDLVGEAGAEAIVPLTNKRYAMPFVDLIADELYDRLGGGAGTNYVINIDGARVNDDPAIRESFINFMTELQRRAAMNVG